MANSRYERYQYIYGNTARAVEMPVETQAQAQQEERKVQQPRKKKQVVRSNRAVLEFDGRFAMTVAVGVMAVVIICVSYLFGQSQLNIKAKNVASKRTELASLVSKNQAKESNLEKKTDLDEIKKYAKEELDMIQPTEKNTIYYEGTPSDYVRQYAEIGSTE